MRQRCVQTLKATRCNARFYTIHRPSHQASNAAPKPAAGDRARPFEYGRRRRRLVHGADAAKVPMAPRLNILPRARMRAYGHVHYSAGVQAQRRMLTMLMWIARAYLWSWLPRGGRALFYSINVMRARH